MSEQIDDGGPAFPSDPVFTPGGQQACGGHYGMSLLAWFAAHAPEMTETWWSDSRGEGERWATADAAWRFEHATEMLAELRRRQADGEETQPIPVEALEAAMTVLAAEANGRYDSKAACILANAVLALTQPDQPAPPA